MAEENTFNFENYTQDQAIDFGNEQALQGDAQIFNQNEAQIDPSAYFQEGNTVLKETAGIEGVTVDDNLFNQNNTYQDNTMDTNAIFGNTLKTGTEVPEYFGQGTTTTTTNVTNIDEGTNFFGETTQTQVPESNFDTNAYFSDNNVDTNAIFQQSEPIQTTTTTTTETNTYFNQAQEIQPQFGETQVLPTTETNQFTTQFIDSSPQDFGQIQTTTTTTAQPFEQNSYEPYKATGAQENINALGYGTSEAQTGFNIKPANITPPPQPFFPPVAPITQTKTTTTKTFVQQNPIPEPVFPNTTQTFETLDYEQYPTTSVPKHQPQYDTTQFQQFLDATPLTTSTFVTPTEPQYSPESQQPVTIQQTTPTVVPQANIQATYTAIPPPKPKITYVQPTNVITQPTTTVVPAQQTYVEPTYTQVNEVPVQTQYTQPGHIPGYQYINKLVDEDFKRGRPVYKETVIKQVTPTLQTNGQVNQYNAPTYRVGDVTPAIRNNIGLSKLGYSNSYNLGTTNVPTLNNITPTITTPTINVPNVNVPSINTPNLNVPSINTPNLNVPNINVPSINTPNLNVPNINVPTLNTPNLNVPNINVPTLNTPNLNVPNINVPTLNTPNLKVPNLNVPSINTPNLNVPNLNVPSINTPTLNTPNLNVPNINVPSINTPTINTPSLNVPNINVPSINTPTINTPNLNVPNINVPSINTPNLNVPSINTPNINTNLGLDNLGNALNNNINNLNTNLTNNVNNVVGNINSGLDKMGKASSYNVGANTITPLLNNAGLQTANIAADNTRLPQLKDFL